MSPVDPVGYQNGPRRGGYRPVLAVVTIMTGALALSACNAPPGDEGPEVVVDSGSFSPGRESPDGVEGPESALDSATSSRQPAERPDTIQGTISLEGMDEPMTYWLYRSPPGFAPAFTAYLPIDIISPGSSSGDTIRFVANFGGRVNDEMYVAVIALGDDSAAVDAARRTAQRLGDARQLTDGRYPWAIRGYSFRSEGSMIGTAAAGRHAGQLFELVTHYPAEAGDGFGPRLAGILRSWRWSDTGDPLAGE